MLCCVCEARSGRDHLLLVMSRMLFLEEHVVAERHRSKRLAPDLVAARRGIGTCGGERLPCGIQTTGGISGCCWARMRDHLGVRLRFREFPRSDDAIEERGANEEVQRSRNAWQRRGS